MNILKDLDKTRHALLHQYANHDHNAPIITVNGISIQYDTGLALDNVSFELPRAIRLAVVGPNGAGKSTLIKSIAGLLSPSQGEIRVFGKIPGEHICIAYVPQRSQVDWQFPVSVRDVVMMGRIGKLGLLKSPGRKEWAIVDHALEQVNLSHLSKRQISELSGGQQQRMFIARALAQEAELMLMDEPLTGLDMGSQEDILNLLSVLREDGVTILVTLHDLRIASERFDSVMLLNHRLIGFGLPKDVFTQENLSKAYGNRLDDHVDLAAIDDTCCMDGDHP